MMDSLFNFVKFCDNDFKDRKATEQEPFSPDTVNVGLEQLPDSEESVDLRPLLDIRDQGNGTRNGNALFESTIREEAKNRPTASATAGRPTTQQQKMDEAIVAMPSGQPVQQYDSSSQLTSGLEPIRFQNISHTVDDMLLTIAYHDQAQIVSDQADSEVPVLTLRVGGHELEGGPIEFEMDADDSFAYCTSATWSQASSPERPTMFISDTRAERSHVGSTPIPASGGSMSERRFHPHLDTDEYRRQRERNNIAVRKCRMRKKQRQMEMQDKVEELGSENANLKKQVEMLTKELTVFKSLLDRSDATGL